MTKQARAGGTIDDSLAATIRGSANRIFLAGLGAFVRTQQEGSKAFESLVEQGSTVFDALVKQGAAMHAHAVEAADDTVAEMKSAAAETWKRLEGIFEDRVAATLHSLNLATKSDIDQLARRLSAAGVSGKKALGRKKKPRAKPAARRPGRTPNVRRPR